MPTLSQVRETINQKIAKFGPSAHCNVLVVSEELRQEAVKNKAEKTRISLETYSAQSYRDWNAMLEQLMEECGYNPLLLIDLIRLLVLEARRQGDGEINGIQIALRGLCKIADYEEALRKAKSDRLAKRKKRSDSPRP